MDWNLKQAITISAFNLISSDGKVEQSELKGVYESDFFSKFIDATSFDWFMDLDLSNILEDVSEKFPSIFQEEEESLKRDLLYEMIKLSGIDGDIANEELEIIKHTAESIGLSIEDVTDILNKYALKLEADLKKVNLKNAKRSGFSFSEGVIMSAVSLITSDGVIDDREIKTMKTHKFFSKYHSKGNESLAVTIMNDENYSLIDLISSELSEVFKKQDEATKIDFIDALIDLATADSNVDTDESVVIDLVSESMGVSQTTLNERIDKSNKRIEAKNIGLSLDDYDQLISKTISLLQTSTVEDVIGFYEANFKVEKSEAREAVKNLAMKNGLVSKYEEYDKKETKKAYILLGVIALIVLIVVQAC